MTHIRKAVSKDLITIEKWLKEEEHEGITNFLCNWGSTKAVFCEGGLIVATDESDEAIAYLWKDFGILEVCYKHRGKGVGSKLVEHGLELLSSNGKIGVKIQCEPAESVAFWEKQGFTIYQQQVLFGENFGYKIFTAANASEPKSNRKEANVDVDIYPKEVKWNRSAKPIKRSSSVATADNSSLRLVCPIEIFMHHPIKVSINDVVKISINGDVIFFDKIKYPEAIEAGVVCDGEFLSIKEISKAKQVTN